MRFGSFMEFHTRTGHAQSNAFAESFNHIDLAESLGLDTVWLAESHFTPERAVLSAPLLVAAAISERTERLRIGTAVHILPLSNPVQIAEHIATLDHISKGRFEYGVGRSGLPSNYEGYDIPYRESRERFYEGLQIIQKSFNTDRFSHHGKYFKLDNVCLTPKPLQDPYPPLKVAATTTESFSLLGEMGLPIFVGVRSLAVNNVAKQVRLYKQTLREHGYQYEPNISLRIPIHVSNTTPEALICSKDSFMRQFQRLGSQLQESVSKETADSSEERAKRSAELAQLNWDDIQGEKVAVGDPQLVIEQLKRIQSELGIREIIAEFNAGELIPANKIKQSLELFCKEVIPAFSG